jgi:hypothetical protein
VMSEIHSPLYALCSQLTSHKNLKIVYLNKNAKFTQYMFRLCDLIHKTGT